MQTLRPEAEGEDSGVLGRSGQSWLLVELLRFLSVRNALVRVDVVGEGHITGVLERFDSEQLTLRRRPEGSQHVDCCSCQVSLGDIAGVSIA